MPAKSTGDTPAKVVLDLDAIEQEDRPAPYVVKIKGKHFTFIDPEDLDWWETASLAKDQTRFFDISLDQKSRDVLRSMGLPTRHAKAIMDSYLKYYGLIDDEGNPVAS